MAALLERYHSKHFPDYFLQRADCPDHTPAGYNPALALTDGRPGKKSMFMSYVIYLYAFKKNKLGYAAAYSVIFFILVGIFTAVLFKTQKEQIFGEGE